MKKIVIGIFIVLVVIVALGYWVEQQWFITAEMPDSKTYKNEEVGISFRYPVNYFLEERVIDETHRKHVEVTLTEDTEENRLVREGKSPGREGLVLNATEGAVAITVGFYQNDLDNVSLEEWVVGNGISNFKLANTGMASSTIGGRPAVTYGWSGLYEGKTIVTEQGGVIVYFSVTYIASDDPIRSVFQNMLDTVLFTEPYDAS